MSENVSKIVVAEDDPEDRFFFQEAWEQLQAPVALEFVEDGVELTDFLWRRGAHRWRCDEPLPALIVTDLNMPRKDGREALAEIRANDQFGRIPVIVFTTSASAEDVRRSYDLGANCYVQKPETHHALTQLFETLYRFWFEFVTIPPVDSGNCG